jgi:hypothetical protein
MSDQLLQAHEGLVGQVLGGLASGLALGLLLGRLDVLDDEAVGGLVVATGALGRL